jgi:hypothetical protein
VALRAGAALRAAVLRTGVTLRAAPLRAGTALRVFFRAAALGVFFAALEAVFRVVRAFVFAVGVRVPRAAAEVERLGFFRAMRHLPNVDSEALSIVVSNAYRCGRWAPNDSPPVL